MCRLNWKSTAVPFEPIKTANVSEVAAQQIRSLIAHGVLSHGDQLPGERDLAARLDISRTSLRTALQALVSEGLLISRHGAGLWVSSSIGSSFTDPLFELLTSSESAMLDFVQFRIMMESECAAFVAAHSMQSERDHIGLIHERLRVATDSQDVDEYIQADTDFHMAIIEGTGNVVLIQIARSLQTLLTKTVALNQRAAFKVERNDEELKRQHLRINDAIQTMNEPEARAAMHDHLTYFKEVLEYHDAAELRSDLIERRKQWNKLR